MATFNWHFSEYNCLNPNYKMKETHRISPWNKQSEEKLRAYMNEIVGMASDGIEVPKSWSSLISKYKIWGKDVQLDLTPMKSDEEREIEQLKAKLSQLQREIEEREAAFEKKNKLSKIRNEILEMFNLTVDDLKEIVSIL